jgi:hypothetical protein
MLRTKSPAGMSAVDQRLDRSRLDDTKAEDRINRQVKQLEEALDELRSD